MWVSVHVYIYVYMLCVAVTGDGGGHGGGGGGFFLFFYLVKIDRCLPKGALRIAYSHTHGTARERQKERGETENAV